MTTHDGTQERTLDPPDNSLSDAEMRACERAAGEGFDELDRRARRWINREICELHFDLAHLIRTTLLGNRPDLMTLIGSAALRVRARYIAECAEDYWGDLIEQEKYAQEP